MSLYYVIVSSQAFDDIGHRAASTGETIRVVAHLGDGETSTQLSSFRLKTVWMYFAAMDFGDAFRVNRSQIVLVEGDRVAGRATIEIYLGKKLLSVGTLRRGRDVCVFCCTPDGYGRGKNGFGHPIRVHGKAAPN